MRLEVRTDTQDPNKNVGTTEAGSQREARNAGHVMTLARVSVAWAARPGAGKSGTADDPPPADRPASRLARRGDRSEQAVLLQAVPEPVAREVQKPGGLCLVVVGAFEGLPKQTLLEHREL